MVLLTSLFDGQPPGRRQGPVDAGQPAQRPHRRCRPRSATRSPRAAGSARCRRRPRPAASASAAIALRRSSARSPSAPGCCGSWCRCCRSSSPSLVIRFKLRRGQRTADGRAVCDQVEGFQTYLATAEADQLRFEEGEDIFSKYLPWAIVFELADRWAKICGDLVGDGPAARRDAVLVRRQLQHGRLQHRLPHQQPDHAPPPRRRRRAAAAPASAAAARSAAAASPAAAAAAAAAAAGEPPAPEPVSAELGARAQRTSTRSTRRSASRPA